jgi:DNA replication protein DnaC
MTEVYLKQHEAYHIKDWQWRDPEAPFPKELAAQIARGEIPCPLCKNGSLRVVLVSPSNPGKLYHESYHCFCNLFKRVFLEFNAKIPPKYREVQLWTLKPSEHSMLPLEQQAALIKQLQAAPNASWAFFGPAGTSKTTFAIALYKQALFQDLKQRFRREDWYDKGFCWRITAKHLLEEIHNYDYNRERYDEEGNRMSSPPVPTVTRDKIIKAAKKGYRPRLFLEEIDKVKGTETRFNNLFEIVDTLYEQKGQLVLNTNMTLAEFSGTYGAAFERRVAEMCTVKDFFQGVTV